MTLSDEAAQKNLLIQLADRDIISHETLLERFKEIPQIENIRLKRELEKRETAGPPKASPFHNANHKNDLEKIDKQNQFNMKMQKQKESTSQPPEVKPNGRPPLKQDETVRKQRVEQPRSKPGVAEILVWSDKAWNQVSELITKAYLSTKQKKNLRQLTKAEFQELEMMKLDIFSNLEAYDNVENSTIISLLKANVKAPKEIMFKLKENNIDVNEMDIDSFRKYVIGAYIESKIG
jgi:hypothetical protein